MRQDIEIEIMLDGELYGSRLWPAVPRVGEYVYLRRGTTIARVDDAIWGKGRDSENSNPNGMLSVTIFCATTPDKTNEGG